ncbi:MAG: hypothetical protein K0Q57_1102 [Gammaproteobacteria bacterium]|nr:hypothetical protein [Gammaproteobacteria bacterium]
MEGEIMLAYDATDISVLTTQDQLMARKEKYNQNKFIANVREQLEKHYQGRAHFQGYCNGLASYWVYMKKSGRESEFMDVYASLVEWNKRSKLSEAMEKFLLLVAYFQSPQTYSYMPGMNQSNFADAIINVNIDSLRVNRELNLSFNFSREELHATLQKLPLDNKIILIRSPDHTVAAIKRGEICHYYDANMGMEIEIDAENLANVLFDDLQAGHHGKYLPLQIEIYEDQTIEASALPKAVSIIQELLDSDRDIERDDAWPEYSALFSAIFVGDIETSAYLISQGAKVNPKAIEVAAAENQFEMIKFLHGLKIDVSKALPIYARDNLCEEIQELIELGVDINYRDEKGNCALKVAILAGSYNSVETLLEAGAWFAGANTLAPSKEKDRINKLLGHYASLHSETPFAQAARLHPASAAASLLAEH